MELLPEFYTHQTRTHRSSAPSWSSSQQDLSLRMSIHYKTTFYQEYIFVVGKYIVHLQALPTDLPQDSVVKRTIYRNSLKDSFSDHNAQYPSCYFQKIHNAFIHVEFIECLESITKMHESKLRTEYLFNTKSHPLSQQTASITSFILFLKNYLHLFEEVYLLKLRPTRHQNIRSIDMKVLRFFSGP